jgi:long-chain fatty acid transport protein
LPTSELGFGVDLIWPLVEVDSSIAGLAAGTTEADAGVSPVPSVGWVHKLDGSPFTIGLGVYGVAGFRTNYPASTTNPLLLPQSNTPGVPGGLGRSYTSSQFLNVAPTASLAVTDYLSIGVSPLLTLGELFADPFVFAVPDDADGSGVPRYPSASGTHMSWGAGAQVGVFYIVNDAWRLGAALKSPEWMEPFEYNAVDELGRPQAGRFHLDLPMIGSLGASYAGIENALVAVDVRYFDYKNTEGFDKAGFAPDGSLRGPGWRSVFSVSTGVQYRLAEPLYVRAGYTYNQNPEPESQAMFAVAAPLHYQHQMNVGGSYQLARNVSLNAAYSYWFEHEVTGPIFTPLGTVPGSSVTSRETVHIASMGVTVGY